MRETMRDLPPMMMSPETGRPLVRGIRALTVTYKGESLVVECPGYYPADGGEEDGVLIGDDMEPADQALQRLKDKMDGLPATTHPELIHDLR